MVSARVSSFVIVLASFAAWSCKPTTTTPPPTGGTPTAAASFDNPGGMWMPSQLAAQKQTLQSLGVAFDPATLQDPTSFPLGAVVSLGGCSGSFVSDQGLVITNHHCVIGALQNNSTPEHNLLVDGFLAADHSQERPAGNQHVYVTQSLTDVTGEVTQGLDTIADPKQRFDEIHRRTRGIEQRCESANAGHACDVRSFFEGSEYWLVDALDLADVRLVYAPHSGIGVFGGEIDNWRWPRHTGDFAMLRAYVGKDGKPAAPSPDNVPYTPPHHLKIASAPLQPGDFVMVAGYPGRTNRLSTAAEVRDAMQWRYPRDIERYGETIAVLEALGKERPELAIKAASRVRRLANYYTNFKGMLEGLQKGGLADQKAKAEAELEAWIEGDAARKAKYGTVLDELAALDAEYRKTRDRDAVLRELAEASSLVGATLAFAVMIDNPEVPRAELQAGIDAAAKGFDPDLDRALLRLALTRAVRQPAESRPDEVLTALLGPQPQGGDTAAWIEAGLTKLFAKTKLTDTKFRAKLLAAKDLAALRKLKDPFVKAAVEVRSSYIEARQREDVRAGNMSRLRPVFVAALREWSKTPLAPDANSTLRITYGTVKGYELGGTKYEPFTTLSQMVAKHTGQSPFGLPATALAAARADKAPYVASGLADVPLDFLADLDITGGNSGSATLNAKGELVGLAFDGNYESIASNWMFIPGITRSIHVDVRFIEWVLDAVDEGDHLLREMGVTPKLTAQSTKAESGPPPAQPEPAAVPEPPATPATPAANTPATPPKVAG
ncbi:MAG: S46 family peptidase [Nannocystaceae bacterium]|nr:S46 family peptidase [Nannocystaceae bacterium]